MLLWVLRALCIWFVVREGQGSSRSTDEHNDKCLSFGYSHSHIKENVRNPVTTTLKTTVISIFGVLGMGRLP